MVVWIVKINKKFTKKCDSTDIGPVVEQSRKESHENFV